MSEGFKFFGGKGSSRSFKVIALNKKQIKDSMPTGMNQQNRYHGRTPAAAASKAFTRYFNSPDTKLKLGQKVRVVIMEVTQGSKNKVFKYNISRVRNDKTRMLNGIEINKFKNRVLSACNATSSSLRSGSSSGKKSGGSKSKKSKKTKKTKSKTTKKKTQTCKSK